MNNLGDFDASAVVYGKFVSARADTGAPATLTSGALSVYKDNSTTQSTSGVTFTGDFDSLTGLNHFTVDTSSDGTFYSAGSFFDIVITTGTVNSVSAVGYCVGQFTLRKTSSLKPTTAGRTLDVSAGGEAGVDWANVGSPTTSLALTGTTIAVTQKVDVDTIKTNPVVNGGTITFPTTATLASTTNITAGTITTVTNLTNAPTAGDLTATMKTSVTTAATAATPTAAAVTGAVGSVTARVTANTDQLNGDATSAANIAKTTRAIGRGTVGSASSTTSIVTSAFTPNGVAADQFKGRIVTFDADTTTTSLRGQSTDITASSGVAAPVFTVTALTTAPVSGDTFSVT